MALRIQSSLPVIKSPDRFEEDFGSPGPEKLAKIERTLRRFMREIRALHDTTCGGLPYCSTCALEPKTDSWPGFVPTAYGFMHAIVNGKIFACHSDQPRWRENEIVTTRDIQKCRGFQRIVDNERDRAIEIATKYMSEIKLIV